MSSTPPKPSEEKKPTAPPIISDLAKEVEDARVDLETAATAESVARSKRTEATNRYNRASKAFDDAVAAMKKKAPRDTDWRR